MSIIMAIFLFQWYKKIVIWPAKNRKNKSIQIINFVKSFSILCWSASAHMPLQQNKILLEVIFCRQILCKQSLNQLYHPPIHPSSTRLFCLIKALISFLPPFFCKLISTVNLFSHFNFILTFLTFFYNQILIFLY